MPEYLDDDVEFVPMSGRSVAPEARLESRIRIRPDRLETSSVKWVGVTPLLSFGIVMMSAVIYGGFTTWIVIYFAIAVGNIAGLMLAYGDRSLLMRRWSVAAPPPWMCLLSPVIYLIQRGLATRAHESGPLRPLWRWVASVAILIFALVQIQLWGGAFSQLTTLT